MLGWPPLSASLGRNRGASLQAESPVRVSVIHAIVPMNWVPRMEEFAEPSVCAVCPPMSIVSKPMPAVESGRSLGLRCSAAQSGEGRVVVLRRICSLFMLTKLVMRHCREKESIVTGQKRGWSRTMRQP